MNKTNKSQWKSDIKKIFPRHNLCRPACFVPINNGILISAFEANTVFYIEGKDLDKLLTLIPWDEKLDTIRKLVSDSNVKS